MVIRPTVKGHGDPFLGVRATKRMYVHYAHAALVFHFFFKKNICSIIISQLSKHIKFKWTIPIFRFMDLLKHLFVSREYETFSVTLSSCSLA
jgi:hypothetical protein